MKKRFVCMVPASSKTTETDYVMRKSVFPGIDEIILEKTDEGVHPVSKDEIDEISVDPWLDVSSNSERVVARVSDVLGLPEDDESVPLFVVTNREKLFGSGELTKSFLEDFMKENGWKTAVCLPSSIHEWLIMQGQAEDSIASLTSMVQEINESEVAPRDRLGNRAYRAKLGADGALIIE